MTDTKAETQAIWGACISLVLFSALTAVALWAWFARAESPWSWKPLLATVSMIASLVMSVLVWRAPTRTAVHWGIGILLSSLLRVGPPGSWTSSSFVLVAITAVLLIPLVHAASVLPRGRG